MRAFSKSRNERAYARTHSVTHTYACMHAHIQSHIRTLACTHTFSHIYVRLHARTHSVTYTYACMHAHMHTRTRIHYHRVLIFFTLNKHTEESKRESNGALMHAKLKKTLKIHSYTLTLILIYYS